MKIKYINILERKHSKEEHQNSKSSKLLENSKKEREKSETLRIVASSGRIWWQRVASSRGREVRREREAGGDVFGRGRMGG